MHRGRRRVRDKLEQAAALLGPEHRKSILERLHRFRSERFVVDGELVLQGVDDDDDGLGELTRHSVAGLRRRRRLTSDVEAGGLVGQLLASQQESPGEEEEGGEENRRGPAKEHQGQVKQGNKSSLDALEGQRSPHNLILIAQLGLITT